MDPWALHFDDEIHEDHVNRKDDGESVGTSSCFSHLDPHARDLPRLHPAEGLPQTRERVDEICGGRLVGATDALWWEDRAGVGHIYADADANTDDIEMAMQ